MQRDRLVAALSDSIGRDLAKELTEHFIKIRHDTATRTFERASPGKFVETFVQCLQQISQGSFESNLSVDSYLNTRVENDANLPDGLRFSAGRVARSIYTMRNKRNIAHIGAVDPNQYDLEYIHHAASWVMAELLRNSSGVSMEEAGALIELLQAPVGTLVEEIDGIRLVHAKVSTSVELLILLHSHHPDHVSLDDIRNTLTRRSSSSVRARVSDLKNDKLIHGDKATGYRLTAPGYQKAVEEISKLRE